MTQDKLVLVGKIVAVHGIKGQVKIQSFTALPANFVKYGEIFNQEGKVIVFSNLSVLPNGIVLAKAQGCSDRTQAEQLIGTTLFVNRDAFPPTEEDEYYFEDLVNLKVIDQYNNTIGYVKAVCDYGAGVFLDIDDQQGKARTLPFNEDSILEVIKGHILINPEFLL